MPSPFRSLESPRRALVAAAVVGAFALTPHIARGAHAQAVALGRGSDGRAHNPGLPGWCETPVADRQGEAGCYTTAITELGVPPRGAIYWHLDTFETLGAAEANRGPRGTVVGSHHQHWLFTIAEAGWRPAGGERVAMIGPLTLDPDTSYTAHYMETVIPAGFQQGGPGHRHPGPEAWYVLEGGQCLETPNGVLTARAGESMLAPDGWPMTIASLGSETRRAVVLILHRSGEPFSMPVGARPDAPHAHWTPKGLCSK